MRRVFPTGRVGECDSDGDIRLLTTWTYFDEVESRRGRYTGLRFVPSIRNANWVARYQLGERAPVQESDHRDYSGHRLLARSRLDGEKPLSLASR
jgi:hypothetical protein